MIDDQYFKRVVDFCEIRTYPPGKDNTAALILPSTHH